NRRMGGDSLPAPVPYRPGTEHRIELRLPGRESRSVVDAVAHAHAVEEGLRVTLDGLRGIDAKDIKDRRHYVDRVAILSADLAPGRRSRGPRDDTGITGP